MMATENIISKSIGVLLYEIKQQTNDLLVLKKLSESNILLKDPNNVLELINTQLQFTNKLINKAYNELYNTLTPQPEHIEQPATDKPKEDVPKPKEEVTEQPEEPKPNVVEEPKEENEESEEFDKDDSDNLNEFVDEDYIKKSNDKLKIKSGISDDLKRKIEEL